MLLLYFFEQNFSCERILVTLVEKLDAEKLAVRIEYDQIKKISRLCDNNFQPEEILFLKKWNIKAADLGLRKQILVVEVLTLHKQINVTRRREK